MVSKTKAIKDLKKTTATVADDFLSGIPKTLSDISTTTEALFPYAQLSKAEEAFESELTVSGLDASNSTIAKIAVMTRDLLYDVITNIQTCERFIALHVPPMEDGNNFGVSVQQVVSKELKERREAFEKRLGSIAEFYDKRAGAVEKLNLPKVTATETKVTDKSDSKGGKDGDQSTESVKVSTKEETTQTGYKKENYYRLKHLVALDVQFYAEMKSLCITIYDSYALILDNMEKNKDKLTAPKGTSGGNAMSMF